MIKPNELRIGNLFHSTKRIKGIKMPFGIAKVLTLGLFGLEWLPPDQIPAQVEVWNESEYSEIEPIPLTPEWLEKFGFEKLSAYEEVNSEDDYIWQKEGQRSPTILISSGRYYEDNYGVPLKHVHQLQNLYWCLTGEELTITVTPPTPSLHDK